MLIRLAPYAILLALIAAFLFKADWSFFATFNISLLWEYRSALASGIGMTCLLAGVAGIVGFSCGIVLSVVSRSSFAIVRWLIVGLTEVLRNTPLIVQVIWVHFALPLVTGYNMSPIQSGLIAISLQASAYFSEIFRGGIAAIPKGQWDAASALGLTAWPKWTRVILPQAIRIMIPALTNLFIGYFKATALLSVIQVNELMTVTTRISNYTFRPLEFVTFTAVFFLLFGNILSFLAHRIEKRFGRSGN